MNDDLFIRYFTVRYQLYKLTNYMEHTPELEETDSYLHATDFARAWMMGIIPTEEVYREMMGRISSPSQIKAITMVLNDNVRFNKEKKDTPISKHRLLPLPFPRPKGGRPDS